MQFSCGALSSTNRAVQLLVRHLHVPSQLSSNTISTGITLLLHLQRLSTPLRPLSSSRGSLHVVSGVDPKVERALAGENFGARDPTAGELASNFSDKVLGNWDTEHVIRPPEAIGEITGLKNKKCLPCEGGNVPKLDGAEINRLRLQCPGWKVTKNAHGIDCIAYDWKVKNFHSGVQLLQRIGELADQEGHHPDLHLTNYNEVNAELTTHAVGGLTQNDFIVAAKINEIVVEDLMPKRKPKFWA